MPKPVVFISYITEEAKLAALIKEHIEDAFLGMIKVFVSSDGSSIEPGRRWLTEISTNLRDAQIMLILCSQASVKRPWINFESGAAWVRDIYAVPICHTDLTPGRLPAPLNELQGIKADDEVRWRGVYGVLVQKLESTMPKVDFSDLIANIRAFEEENRERIAVLERPKEENQAVVSVGTPVAHNIPILGELAPNPGENARTLMDWVVRELDFWHINNHIIDFDFYKFLGYELFVTFVSFLIKEGQWGLLADLLEDDLYINNGLNAEARLETFEYASQWVKMCEGLALTGHVAPLGSVLAERHQVQALDEAIPFKQFMDADLFLYLRRNRSGENSNWYPASTINLNVLPRYLTMAQQARYAEQLLRPLGVANLDILRGHLNVSKREYERLFGHRTRGNVLYQLDVTKIGSR